jgi:transcriptional regulator with XRE-family HTH domain
MGVDGGKRMKKAKKRAVNKRKRSEVKIEVGRRMLQIRNALGYTQEKMVSFFKMGRSNLSQIETGYVFPKPFVLDSLQKNFGVSIEWLLSNKGKMFYRDCQVKDLKLKDFDEMFNFGENKEEIFELLISMSKVPMIKHAILGFFLEYKIKYKESIRQAMEEFESDSSDDLKVNINI